MTTNESAKTTAENQKHIVSDHREFISQGWAETVITMASGRVYDFRFANGKIHLMSGPTRCASYHASEYRRARENAKIFLWAFRQTPTGQGTGR